MCAPGPAHAQTDEDALKALFIYKFTDYITWPETHPEFRICTPEKDRVTETLEEIASQKTVADRPIEVLHLDPLPEDGPVPDPPRCDLLWLGKETKPAIAKAVAAWARVGTLVVSDKLDAADKGAAIGLVTEDGRVRFEVDRPTLTSAELHASAQLLKLARSVQ